MALFTISTDAHVVESPALLATFWPNEGFWARPFVLEGPTGRLFLKHPGIAAGIPLDVIWSDIGGLADANDRLQAESGLNPTIRRHRDRQVDGEVIFPTLGLQIFYHPDEQYQQSYARSYNRWLSSELASGQNSMSLGVALTVGNSVEQLSKNLHQNHQDGYSLSLVGVDSISELSDPDLDRFLADLTIHRQALAIHALTARHPPSESDEQILDKETRLAGRLVDRLISSGILRSSLRCPLYLAEFKTEIFDVSKTLRSARERVIVTCRGTTTTGRHPGSAIDSLWSDDYPHPHWEVNHPPRPLGQRSRELLASLHASFS